MRSTKAWRSLRVTASSPNPTDGERFLRLNFATRTPEEIHEGMRRLGVALTRAISILRDRCRVISPRMISLHPLTESNRAEVEALRTSPGQERFVSSVVDSLLEATEKPGDRAIYWAVCDDETPVGFVMISDDVDGPEYFPQYL